MKYVLLMILMTANVTLMAQPLNLVIDPQTGQIKGIAKQVGKDIVIVNPKGKMMIIPDALPPPTPRAPALLYYPNASTNPSSPNSTANPRGK